MKGLNDMVYIILADGFEEVEAIEPLDIMRRCGIDAVTVSLGADIVTGAHGVAVRPDITIDKVDPDKMEALVLPGGAPGYQNLDASPSVHALINHALTGGRYLCAICAAPSILGKKQILSGKNATCFPGFENYLYGANVLNDRVVVDGKIITSRGAGTAADFGFAIASALCGEDKANEIKRTMQY